ncbi:hypothetical protein A5666_16140 [Mycolicibacterium fortuitum]|nr:hypothetical protein A5666_16140 [Mycolicibacterium fortuitum]
MLQQIESQADAMTLSGEEPRKHHLVPRFYLQRWTMDGNLRATDLDSKKTFITTAENAARRTDFYRFEDGTYKWGSPVWFEVFLSVLEGRVAGLTNSLADGTTELHDLSIDELVEFVWFLAFQLTRGMNYRRGLLWTLVQEHAIKYESSGDDSLRRILSDGGYEVTDESVAMMRSQLLEMRCDPGRLPILTAFKLKQSAESAAAIFPHLASRAAVVYRTPRRLVTCDEPVVPLDWAMGSTSGDFGVANAPVIVYPLSPERVLALFRPDFPIELEDNAMLSHSELLALNQSILGNAYLHGFELPSMHFTSQLYVPLLPPAGERVVVGRTGRGEEIHKLTPGRRWRGQPQAPHRPVERWWP